MTSQRHRSRSLARSPGGADRCLHRQPTRSTVIPGRSAFPPWARVASVALLRSKVTLCGCGALGTVLANHLARAGVGYLRIIDRDFIETHNLQRQILFDEQDVRDNLPKAEAAARKLRLINSTIDDRARGDRPRPHQRARPRRRRRPDSRRYGQLRDPLPDQRRGHQAGQALGLTAA